MALLTSSRYVADVGQGFHSVQVDAIPIGSGVVVPVATDRMRMLCVGVSTFRARHDLGTRVLRYQHRSL
jgi:hypothetical protein